MVVFRVRVRTLWDLSSNALGMRVLRTVCGDILAIFISKAPLEPVEEFFIGFVTVRAPQRDLV